MRANCSLVWSGTSTWIWSFLPLPFPAMAADFMKVHLRVIYQFNCRNKACMPSSAINNVAIEVIDSWTMHFIHYVWDRINSEPLASLRTCATEVPAGARLATSSMRHDTFASFCWQLKLRSIKLRIHTSTFIFCNYRHHHHHHHHHKHFNVA